MFLPQINLISNCPHQLALQQRQTALKINYHKNCLAALSEIKVKNKQCINEILDQEERQPQWINYSSIKQPTNEQKQPAKEKDLIGNS